MADIRAHPEQDMEHEGASKSEILIEAARRNNTDLLAEVVASVPDPDKLAALINETKSVLGNYLYHEAALRGNYEIIDALLDIPNFECDPINRLEGDTPLHSAIRYLNTQSHSNPDVATFSRELIGMMIEAGSDPRVRNKAQLTPYQLADPRNTALRETLQNAMDAALLQGDFVGGDAEEAGLEEGDVGSASDEEEDGEEERREVERRRREKGEGNGGAS